jgi:phosphate transport system protein
MKHFLQEMDLLAGKLLQLAKTVATTTQDATQSLCERRPDVAKTIIAGDDAIDREEVRIEEECIRILVLQQPVASDLRRVIGALKINGDLERMADLAVDIANQAVEFARVPDLMPIPPNLLTMASLTAQMVRGCLDAFVQSDQKHARSIRAMDDEVDQLHREIVNELKTMVREHPGRIDAGFALFSVARYLERIADHAANIAEDVVYMTEGSIIRHQPNNDTSAD